MATNIQETHTLSVNKCIYSLIEVNLYGKVDIFADTDCDETVPILFVTIVIEYVVFADKLVIV